MSEKQRAKIVLRILNKIYPKTPIPLKHRNMFTLLVSVLLSAQCTDVNVNNVTKNIYPKYNKPEHFIKLGRKNPGIFITIMSSMLPFPSKVPLSNIIPKSLVTLHFLKCLIFQIKAYI